MSPKDMDKLMKDTLLWNAIAYLGVGVIGSIAAIYVLIK
jgi:hypothetical protein